MKAISLALGLGFVAGLRTFTPVAAVLLARRAPWAGAATLAAAGEYVADALPTTPARTEPLGLLARAASGGFAGWRIAARHDRPGLSGAVAGVAGALLGAFGGVAARRAAIGCLGPYPAALAEDLVAIGLAALIVTR